MTRFESVANLYKPGKKICLYTTVVWDFVKKNISFSQIFFDERNKTKKMKLSDLAKR